MKHERDLIFALECLKIQQLQLVYISLSRFLIYKNRQVHTFLNRSADVFVLFAYTRALFCFLFVLEFFRLVQQLLTATAAEPKKKRGK